MESPSTHESLPNMETCSVVETRPILQHLPLELFLDVSEYLDADSIRNVALTCRALYQKAKGGESVLAKHALEQGIEKSLLPEAILVQQSKAVMRAPLEEKLSFSKRLERRDQIVQRPFTFAMAFRCIDFDRKLSQLRQDLGFTSEKSSATVKTGVQRALYHYQLSLNIVGPGLMVVSHSWELFFRHFSLAENERMASIHRKLARLAFGYLFQRILPYGILWGREDTEYNPPYDGLIDKAIRADGLKKLYYLWKVALLGVFDEEFPYGPRSLDPLRDGLRPAMTYVSQTVCQVLGPSRIVDYNMINPNPHIPLTAEEALMLETPFYDDPADVGNQRVMSDYRFHSLSPTVPWYAHKTLDSYPSSYDLFLGERWSMEPPNLSLAGREDQIPSHNQTPYLEDLPFFHYFFEQILSTHKGRYYRRVPEWESNGEDEEDVKDDGPDVWLMVDVRMAVWRRSGDVWRDYRHAVYEYLDGYEYWDPWDEYRVAWEDLENPGEKDEQMNEEESEEDKENYDEENYDEENDDEHKDNQDSNEDES